MDKRNKERKAKYCRECGKELPRGWNSSICSGCSGENAEDILRSATGVREAFAEKYRESGGFY